MSDFIDGLEGNYKKLSKENWNNILEEFNNLQNNKVGAEILEFEKEIAVLRFKISIINTCISSLWDMYSRDLVLELKKYGYNQKLDWANKKEYYKNLRLILSSSKTLSIKLEKTKKEFELFLSKFPSSKNTRLDFIKVTTNLSKFMQHYVDLKKVSVAEWLVMVENYERELNKSNGRP